MKTSVFKHRYGHYSKLLSVTKQGNDNLYRIDFMQPIKFVGNSAVGSSKVCTFKKFLNNTEEGVINFLNSCIEVPLYKYDLFMKKVIIIRPKQEGVKEIVMGRVIGSSTHSLTIDAGNEIIYFFNWHERNGQRIYKYSKDLEELLTKDTH
jgi:hypothetical protein